MKCAFCPVVITGETCLGESIPRLCVLARNRNDYRRELARLARGKLTQRSPGTHELGELLNIIANCAERGAILPISFQPECGCSELTECLSGKGSTSGLVTLQDCLSCVVEGRQ
jgi:hypothetical protein